MQHNENSKPNRFQHFLREKGYYIVLALCICANTDPNASLALKHLEQLRGCEVHSSVILSSVDEATFHKLGINLTCEPKYQTEKLFHH